MPKKRGAFQSPSIGASLDKDTSERIRKYSQAMLVISRRERDQHPLEAAMWSAASRILARQPPRGQRAEPVAKVMEILSWLGPPSPPMSETQAQASIDELEKDLLSAGMRATEVLSALRVQGSLGNLDKLTRKRSQGRPITKRHLAVKAYDLSLANPTKSWMQVTRQVCNCGESSHDFQCKDQLLQQVKDLKNVLRKYRILIPPRLRATKPK